MIIKTRVFDLWEESSGNLRDLACAMGISVSQVYRVRQGKRNINQKFIAGAMRAFPGRKLDELFYLGELPDSNGGTPKADFLQPQPYAAYPGFPDGQYRLRR
ncbi:MAG: helix-turn-helix transcriptional regulator [Chloroflexi bacterium]|nr:helix-turn-helix transcriptional regulator [Chloroflexota bacterium]